MPELMIFRAGNYPQGDWPKDRVQKMVDAYDPIKKVEAPVVIGHRYYGQTDEYQYAHGWVQALRLDGAGKVWATIDDFSADVKKAVAEKKLRYISAEFWEYDRRDENESPYLKAVALLGRDTPAVPGAKLPAFFDRSGGVMSVLDEKEFITAFTRKVGSEDKTAFTPATPVDAEDKAAFEPASPETPGAFGKSGAETNQVHEEAKMDDEKLKSLEAELAAAKAQIAAFQKENESLRDGERKAGAQAFFSKLRDEGKLPPALFEKAVELDAKMTEDGRKEYRALFSALETTVDLSGTHAAPKDKAPPAGTGDGSLTAKIRAFQKEKGFAGFAEAAEAYHAANPAAFEEGGVASGGGVE